MEKYIYDVKIMSVLFCVKWFVWIELDWVFRFGLSFLILSICFKVEELCRLLLEFCCRGSWKCILNIWFCDGEVDCVDEFDEEDCIIYFCSVREF